jgi:ABC-2 type transport system ATP-binding protein/lipopolysaccharide transport system ATP-binding protein
MIRIRDVSVKYRLAKERPRTLQEYFVGWLKGRRVGYEDFWALRGISVDILKGETLGIIGPNGAGKSTLLKVIAGVLKPGEGSVEVNGSIAPLIELGAGFDMELTGEENIYLNASILGLSRKEIKRKFERIVEFSELGEFIHSPLKSYSSGMVSRLGFSIATEVDPDLLIIDEILAVGDERFKKKCNERIMSFKERGTTILFVSHNMVEVERLCDKVLWLDRGHNKMYGSPSVVVKEYLGTITSMNTGKEGV